jgi:FkbM family methyltransferase
MELGYEVPIERSIRGHFDKGIFYEPEVSHPILLALRPGDVAIDVGANIGYFTLFMGLLCGTEGHVISFEPVPDNLAKLRNNIALSELHNVTVIGHPASNTVEDVVFYANNMDSGGSALWDIREHPSNANHVGEMEAIPTRTTTLDAEVERAGLKIPRVIKIDAEGAEQTILEGAKTLLTGCKVPYIITELNEYGLDKMGSSQMIFRQFMEGFGYHTFALYFNGQLPKLIPPGTFINSKWISNLLFSKPEYVGELWGSVDFDPSVGFEAQVP